MADTITSTNSGDDAVQESTGRDWAAWFEWLDEHDASNLDHPSIIALLDVEADLPNGWRHRVTTTYEAHIGRAVTPIDEDDAFYVGARRTFRSSPTRAWQIIASIDGAQAWLGDAPDEWWHGTHGGPARGDILATPGGERYEVLSSDDASQLSLRTLGPGLFPSTIQLTVSAEQGRTVIGLYQEGIPEAAMRDQMREHWKRALDRIGGLLDEA